MKLTAYVRVSTATQAEEGFGLDIQQEAIAKWVKSQGHKVVATFSDEGISGAKPVVDREGLASALLSISEGTSEGLIVAKLDRLARTLTVQEAALAHIWNSGGVVFSVDQGEVLRDDPDDPMRTAMRQMVGVFGELERAMIAKRLRDGRKHKAAQGGFAYGSPAFGYRSDPNRRELELDPTEQEALGLIASLRAEGKSIRAIIAILDAQGLKPKRGGHWNPGTLSRILRRLQPAS